jgi:hypothetical protein
MRLPVLIGAWLWLAGTFISASVPEFSHSRDLPPLKMAAADLDTILLKAQSFIAVAGPPGEQDFARESVKVGIRGHEIEIPHFSLASSLAFPKEVFRFSYNYSRPDGPIASLTIDLSDDSRRISVSGESADQVETLSNQLANDFVPYSTPIGGAKFRHLAGACLLVFLLMSLMVSSAYCWNTRRYGAFGMPICSAIGLMLVLLVPWNRFLPGFALYQRYSPFFLVRHAPEICLLGLLAALAGIPLSYFVSRSHKQNLVKREKKD